MPEKTMRDAINEALHQAMEQMSLSLLLVKTSRGAMAAPATWVPSAVSSRDHRHLQSVA